MPILESGLIFPNNIIDVIATHAALIGDPGEVYVYKRPLRSSDPNKSVGIVATDWTPNSNSYEMGRGSGFGRMEPTLQQYKVQVQALVLDMDERRGLALHATVAKLVRDMLVRDPAFHVSWAALTATDSEATERTKRRWITSQQYFSNEMSGSFLYLTTLDFITETETV